MTDEELSFAKSVVNNANHSFLSKEDITANMEENGFLVSENKMIGYTSYLEYDRINNHKLISFDKERSIKDQQQILLMNYCAYLKDDKTSDKFYYKDIPTKSTIKRLCRYIVDFSVEKEFGDFDSTQTKKEGRSK